MANFALRCQCLTHRLFSADILRTYRGAITLNSRNCGCKKRNDCDCPQKDCPHKDPRDTEEECEHYKKIMAARNIENSCLRNESVCHSPHTVCDPMECELRRIEDRSPIPKEVFQDDPPCVPFERKNDKSKCELAELRKCYAKNSRKPCTSHKPICFSQDKTYPMRDAGLKPEIDGRPIIGEAWKRKSWGIKC